MEQGGLDRVRHMELKMELRFKVRMENRKEINMK